MTAEEAHAVLSDPAVSSPVDRPDWFLRMPTGGTIFVRTEGQ